MSKTFLRIPQTNATFKCDKCLLRLSAPLVLVAVGPEGTFLTEPWMKSLDVSQITNQLESYKDIKKQDVHTMMSKFPSYILCSFGTWAHTHTHTQAWTHTRAHAHTTACFMDNCPFFSFFSTRKQSYLQKFKKCLCWVCWEVRHPQGYQLKLGRGEQMRVSREPPWRLGPHELFVSRSTQEQAQAAETILPASS